MNINVIYTPTSTYVLEDGDFRCQHDGETSTEQQTVLTMNGSEPEQYEDSLEVCKCGAYRNIGDRFWEEV